MRSPVSLLILGLVLAGCDSRPPTVQITFLAVGQGDCAVVQYDGRTVLIDAGPKTEYVDAGEKIVVPKLRQMGVTRLDMVLLSHPDEDHVGGLGAILKAYPETEIVMSDAFRESPKFAEDLALWGREKSKVKWLPERSQSQIGAVNLDLFCPRVFAKQPDNDGSMVVRLRFGAAQAVFMGDAPVSVEESLIPLGGWQSELLKAGHHGSATATGREWLGVVKPKWAILSLGANNRYGHPHPRVVQELKEFRVEALRTDREGDLKFEVSEGHFIRVPE